MSTAVGTGTFSRGVHPPEEKAKSEQSSIEVLPTPKEVRVALLQHTGAPNEPAVKNRDEVKAGDVVGTTEAFVSAPVHSPVNGKVGMALPSTLPNGRRVDCVIIKPAGDQLEGKELFNDVFWGEWPLDGLEKRDPDEIRKSVREAGIVGLGGAAFPTHVKLAVPEGRTIDTILVNGCECEPYLTADDRLMTEAPRPVIAGSLFVKRATGAKRVVICVEGNKPESIERLRGAAGGTGVDVKVMKTKYPQGGEKQLMIAALGRTVPTGGLPLDAGTVVVNVGTCAAVARAVLRGKPLTHRVVTVTGAGIATPKNVLAPVGARIADLVEFCGGLKPEAARLVAGGPMMGFTLGSLEAPVTKGLSGVTVLTREEVSRSEETACVRCGRCVDVCPLNLVPTKIALSARHNDWDRAKQYHIMACMECGCCAYTCPASIPLVQLIRLGKVSMPR